MMYIIYTINQRWVDEGWKSQELCKEDIESLRNAGFELCAYWYGIYSVQGEGYMILSKDNKWYLHDLYHCSCYEPLTSLSESLKKSYETLDDLANNCSKEVQDDIKDLIKELGAGLNDILACKCAIDS